MHQRLISLGEMPSERQISDFVDANIRAIVDELNPGASERDERGEVIPRSFFSRLGELGIFSYLLPKSAGGDGGNRRSFGLLLEQIGRYATELEYPSLISMYADLPNVLAQSADPLVIERYVLPMARGQRFATFAYTEQNDSFGFLSHAERLGSSYLLNGYKDIQTGGALADTFLVYVKSEQGDLQVFLVDREDPGVEVLPLKTMGFRSGGMTSLKLTDVKLEPWRLVVSFDGSGQVQEFLNARRIFVVCAMPGLMATMLEQLVEFLHARIRHGLPLTETQLVQAKLGEMYAIAHTSKVVLHDALERMASSDVNAIFDPIVTAAKYTIVENALQFAQNAIRLTGWAGYSHALPFERHFRSIMGGISGQTPQEVLRVLLGVNTIAAIDNNNIRKIHP